jgi:hypothetical protein
MAGAALEPFHGEIFQTSLEVEDEEALHRALDS